MNQALSNRISALIGEDRMNTEGEVNGVWNAYARLCSLHGVPMIDLGHLCRVLGLYLPTNNLNNVISPEGSIVGGGKTDIMIWNYTYNAANTGITQSFPVLLLEGKRVGGDNFDAIKAQLRSYLDDSGFDRCWAIGARGQKMKFWRYIRDRPEDKMRPRQTRERECPAVIERCDTK
ncbi:predicted protein [Postia placenta Mad-698-R]|nr:predicted protein [Postia placenta Mad-698-R]